MSKQRLRTIIAVLAFLNLVWIAIFVIKPYISSKFSPVGAHTAAKIDGTNISRDEWIEELETRFGQDVLEEMIDQEVIRQAAQKYKVKVSKEEVEREYRLMKTTYGSSGQDNKTEKQSKEDIKSRILLEELLTKDVTIPEADKKEYYEKNKQAFRIPDTYHVSHITTETKDQAEEVIAELEKGADFQALALEKSSDEFTANQGGDLGYISKDNEHTNAAYAEAAETMKEKEWSEPIELENGWAVLYLHEKMKGKQYAYQEVKKQISRQIALEQMQTSLSAKSFWDEFDVEWLYGPKEHETK
ncbi:peptidyl-prolyl cis-trans isomerase [Bacillus massiliglaciei]|uniref:peptidyl-prolyl cis-trans isomerase n=1 Tax=Bacillus massiliglaciei TaxID=1816693 RepID=UPI000AD6C2AC|nr:peptidyl-prolyl cis-trans isomerase [Bacillus massiliglaciei]